jgi:hypothetical protein
MIQFLVHRAASDASAIRADPWTLNAFNCGTSRPLGHDLVADSSIDFA